MRKLESKRKISGSVAPRTTLKALFLKEPPPLLPQPTLRLSFKMTGGNVGEDMSVVINKR